MTAKAISKRIKAKGLGKLRWYCQMCEKQCRDENGFKNHTQSAGHQRQLTLFAENSSEYITRFSNTFLKEFIAVLRQRYGTSFVSANTVYQEYIKDKEHLHMNATKWTTLSEFVKHLGREGVCKVEDREDGWWLSYIDRDVTERNRTARELDKLRLEEEERSDRMLQKQLARVQMTGPVHQAFEMPVDPGKIQKGPVSINISANERSRANSKTVAAEPAFDSMLGSHEPHGDSKGKIRRRRSRWQDAPKLSALDEIMQSGKPKSSLATIASPTNPTAESQKGISSKNQKENALPWIRENIMVKVVNRKVAGGAFYGKKGKITTVIDGYGARVSINNSKQVLELDQDDLETVIPKPGGTVLILRGPHRGSEARVESINVENYDVSVTIIGTGERIGHIEYEAVSRVG